MTMPEKIIKDIFRIKVPIPGGLVKYTNAYVLRDKNRNLVIDAGINTPLGENMLRQCLGELQIDLEKTDFFITHHHKDHLQLAVEMAAEGSRIFMGRIDFLEMEARRKNNWFLPEISEFSRMSGFPAEDLNKAYRFFEGHEKTAPLEKSSVTLLEDGDLLQVGEISLQSIMTPGHSKGHMCLYTPEKKLLFAGDHLLGKITPTIQGRFNEENPLKEYFSSLEKISALEVEQVLPGHKQPFSDSGTRIGELRHHHLERADQILNILSEGSSNVYRTASVMNWNIRGEAWENYPPLQRFLAVGETISHLNYLVMEGRMKRVFIDGQVAFSLVA